MKAEDVLKKLGIDFKEDANLDEVVAAFQDAEKERYQKLFENEHASKADELEEKARIKFMATLNNALKKKGLDPKAMEGKPIAERIEELTEKLKAEYSKPGEVQELQQENVKLKNDIEALKQDYEGKIELTKSEVQAEKNNYIKGQKLSKVFEGIPREKVVGGLTAGQVKAAEALLSSNYDIELDANGELVVYQKGTKKQPTGKVEGKEVILNLPDIVNTIIFDELNLRVQSNGRGNDKLPEPEKKEQQFKPLVNDFSEFDRRVKELQAKVA